MAHHLKKYSQQFSEKSPNFFRVIYIRIDPLEGCLRVHPSNYVISAQNVTVLIILGKERGGGGGGAQQMRREPRGLQGLR